MAGVTARELRAIVETERAAERAYDQAKASLASLGRAVDDPHFQRELASAAGVLRAVDQSEMAKNAKAISAFSGTAVADLTKFAGPVGDHLLKSAGVLSYIADAKRQSAVIAAEDERHRREIDRFRPTAAEIAAEHERHLRFAESIRPSIAELASAQSMAQQMKAWAEPSAAEIAARQSLFSEAMKASIPSMSEIVAREAAMFRLSDVAAGAARAMFHVIQDAAKSQDSLMAASRHAMANLESIKGLAATGGAISAAMRSITTPEVDKALKAGFWVVPPEPRGASAFRVTFPYPHSRPPAEIPRTADDQPSPERDERYSDLYVPAPAEIIVPGREGAKRKRGRPPGPVLSRDELLDRLAAGLAALAKHAQPNAPIKAVLLRAGLNQSTVYGYFSDGSFGWQTVPVRWRDVLRLLLQRQVTGLTWAELLGGRS